MDNPAPVGFMRRALAFFIDMAVGIQLGLIVTGLLGLATPLDGIGGLAAMAAAGLISMVYLSFAPLLLPNSLGKFAIASKVVDAATGDKPGFVKFLLRGLTICLWPIEALILMFSSGKRRLGDRLAGTLVLPDAANLQPFHIRAGAPIAAIVVLYFLTIGVLGMAAARSGVFKAAISQLTAEFEKGVADDEFGKPVQLAATPRRVQVVNDIGIVVVGISGPKKSAYVSLLLTREGDKWTYTRAQIVSDPGSRGYSFLTTGGTSLKP